MDIMEYFTDTSFVLVVLIGSIIALLYAFMKKRRS
ncbi:EYxxD motif small membrane protein [Thalassobacillus devorans]